MLIQRPECTTSTATLMSGQYNKNSLTDNTDSKMQQQQQQQQHVKRLLYTAAAATGIVGDVDAVSSPTGQQPTQPNQKAERNLWRLEEIREVLSIMQDVNALELLNDKSVRSEKVFRNIEQIMHRKGFRKKSHAQIWTKWKFLKSTYMTSRRNCVVPKMIPLEIYETLHKMLKSSFSMNASVSSATSMDGDASMEFNNVMSNSDNGDNGGKSEQNELAHPIFGFRLVKSEPVDTGYETTGNNSAISDLDSIDARRLTALSPSNSNGNITQQSFIEIKEERVTDSPSPSPSPYSPLQLSSHTPTTVESHQSSLLIPRNTRSMSISAVMPNSNNNKHALISPSKLPPLRIAPFAKECNMTEALRRANNSPPTLSLNPLVLASSAAASQNIVDENGTTLVTKMFRNSENENSKSAATAAAALNNLSPRPSVLRLPKEVTLQLRAPEIIATAQAPARQTTYALRADRSISNAATEVMPVTIHQSAAAAAVAAATNAFNNSLASLEEPMTSQMAAQMHTKVKSKSQSKQKKKRLSIPTWNDYESSHAAKMLRLSEPSEAQSHETPQESIHDSYSDLNGYQATFKKPRSSSADYADESESQMKKHRDAMEEMIKELTTSMQRTQTEMINRFFENQMELTRREHEHQMKQDQIIMDAFEEQTRQLTESAKQFLAVNVQRSHQKKNSVESCVVGGGGSQMREYELNHTNGRFEEKKQKKARQRRSSSEHEFNNDGWNGEQHIYMSGSECGVDDENDIDNDNMEPTVDPIQFVTSELTDEYDNS